MVDDFNFKRSAMSSPVNISSRVLGAVCSDGMGFALRSFLDMGQKTSTEIFQPTYWRGVYLVLVSEHLS